MTTNLTPRQRHAIAALLTQPNVAAAARAAGISRETVYRWLEQDAFRSALATAEADRLQSVQRGLLALTEAALVALADLVHSDNETARHRAAVAILEQVFRLREIVDFDQRLTRLEEANR